VYWDYNCTDHSFLLVPICCCLLIYGFTESHPFHNQCALGIIEFSRRILSVLIGAFWVCHYSDCLIGILWSLLETLE